MCALSRGKRACLWRSQRKKLKWGGGFRNWVPIKAKLCVACFISGVCCGFRCGGCGVSCVCCNLHITESSSSSSSAVLCWIPQLQIWPSISFLFGPAYVSILIIAVVGQVAMLAWMNYLCCWRWWHRGRLAIIIGGHIWATGKKHNH